jgi:hypothetical protein
MPDSFDPRVVPGPLLTLVRACQEVSDAHLGGGAVLSGAHLRHRLTRDLDLFVHERDDHRELVRRLPALAEMLAELDEDTLRTFRDDLAERLKAVASGPGH